jgi:hypothetical protein
MHIIQSSISNVGSPLCYKVTYITISSTEADCGLKRSVQQVQQPFLVMKNPTTTTKTIIIIIIIIIIM